MVMIKVLGALLGVPNHDGHLVWRELEKLIIADLSSHPLSGFSVGKLVKTPREGASTPLEVDVAVRDSFEDFHLFLPGVQASVTFEVATLTACVTNLTHVKADACCVCF